MSKKDTETARCWKAAERLFGESGLSGIDDTPEGKSSGDIATWFAGRRSEVEKWVDETCQSAISKTRGVLADEIRGLSKRVEMMHELLDQLEHYVEASEESDAEDSKDEGEE